MRALICGIVLCCLSLIISLGVWFRADQVLCRLYETAKDRIVSYVATKQSGDAWIPDLPENKTGNAVSGDTADGADSEPETVSQSESSGNDIRKEEYVQEDGDTYFYIIDSALGPMLYYNQNDERWKDYLYGGIDPMSQYGCGPTAAAMLISSFTSSNLTPPQAADWAVEHGLFVQSNGSSHALIPDMLTAYGFTVESVKDRSAEHVSSLLGDGTILIALMGQGTFTQNGHFIIITQLEEDQTVRIADPNSYENSTKAWSLSQILSELKQSYDNGAPLWAVSLPR